MRLTLHTDYALRILIFLAVSGDEGGTIADIAARYGISRNHLMKVAHQLGTLGLVETLRGRNGGLRLARPAAEIPVGVVVRQMEEGLRIAECFDAKTNTCPIAGLCGLQPVLGEALKAFLTVLDRYSIADICGKDRRLRKVLLPQASKA